MKNIFASLLVVLAISVSGQSLKNSLHPFRASTPAIVQVVNWSNSIVYMNSPSPVIKGYGPFSDSLKTALKAPDVLFFDNEYFPVQSWADYYLWYTKKYYFLFRTPQLYEAYYHAGDNLGMASFIASSRFYRSYYYPSNILLDFPEGHSLDNQLAQQSRMAKGRNPLRQIMNNQKEDESTTLMPRKKYANLKDVPSSVALRNVTTSNGITKQPKVAKKNSPGETVVARKEQR